MQVPLYNQAGQKIGTTELQDRIFGIEPNKPVMHQALLRQLANARQGNADTKKRDEVAGGGAKPWKQKGTGRARQGSTRSPQWRHGGIVFGPTPRSYEQKMPLKMRRLALRSALSVKVADGQVRVVDDLKFDVPKTREMESVLGGLEVQSSALIVLSGSEHDSAKIGGEYSRCQDVARNVSQCARLAELRYVDPAAWRSQSNRRIFGKMNQSANYPMNQLLGSLAHWQLAH